MGSIRRGWLAILGLAALGLVGCGASDFEEIGHASGDVEASLDEAAQGGSFAQLDIPVIKSRDFLKGNLLDRAISSVVPSAYADACTSVPFSACAADPSGASRSRSFSNCSVGPATLNGTVTLNFSDPACSMAGVGDSVTRVADFQLTGTRGATLAVTSPNGGQEVTVTSSGYSYKVLGIERVATLADGKKLFDISTATTQDIGVTGTSRANRVVNGGTLEITHHLRNYVVDLTPNNVTWNNTCNCAVSGSWTGTASGSITGSFSVTITGCGTATVTGPEGTRNITRDRCTSL